LLFDKPFEVGMGLQVLTFLENPRLSNGSPFSQKGPSWKTQVVQWTSFSTAGIFTENSKAPKRVYVFTKGSFMENKGPSVSIMH
jgi:hypothetical protein